MNRLFLLLVAILFSHNLLAQSDFAKKLMDTPSKPVVMKEYELETLLPSSQYYYPPLFERYEKGDTTLNIDDYRHLYYGYVFSKNYHPHKEPKYVDSLSNILNRDGGVFLDGSTKEIIRCLDSILVERPFSLKFLNIMTYIYSEKVRDEKKAFEYSYKFNMLLSTIFSSGNGVTKESPWSVIYRVDAQTVLSFIGADVAKRTYITYNVEYYFLKERQGNIRGYYFDFAPIYTRPNEPEGKRKLEINPMYNPNSDKYQKLE